MRTLLFIPPSNLRCPQCKTKRVEIVAGVSTFALTSVQFDCPKCKNRRGQTFSSMTGKPLSRGTIIYANHVSRDVASC